MNELDFTKKVPDRCLHCGKERGKHKAKTLNCPITKGMFPQFSKSSTFESKDKK